MYIVLNLLFFLGEAIVLLFTHAYIFTAIDFEKAGWLLCFALQGIFVFRGINAEYNRVHYKNCVMLKIQLNFVVLCLLLTVAFIVLTNDPPVAVHLGLAVLVKFVSFKMLYRKLKYKDDGREQVPLLDFITIHVTFPVLNAWASYQVLY